MAARHYDVVILGRSIGALLAAALLSRRELRVLVLGQGQGDPHYRVEGHTLARRTFTMLSATSPAFRRILHELAQTQRFRQLTTPLDPMFALLDQKIRFEVPPDIGLFSREIEREYREIQQPIAELYTDISQVNAQVDSAFEKEVMWPPGTVWEKVETGRIASALPFAEAPLGESSLLSRMPQGHSFRHVVELPALFASHLGLDVSALEPLATARLHGSWTRGVHSLARGEKDLEDFLVSRIEAHGGVCRLNARAERIVVKRGKLAGIVEAGEEDLTAAEAVLTSGTGEILADLSGGAGVTKKARDVWPRVEVLGGRFVVSLLINDRGLPEKLPRESFLVAQDSSLPHLHLQRFSAQALSPKKSPTEDEKVDPPRSLLVAEMLLPQTGGLHLLGAREAVLAALRTYLPFFERHLVCVDSPHDGLPVWLYEHDAAGSSRRLQLERVHLPHSSAMAEPMVARLNIIPRGYLGLGGEPLRGPIPGTYLVGPSVLPGLGQEGEVLAAWSVAKILTKKDGVRQKLRRQMWTKIETG
jgi:phytoene dehydrogenase-like protein